MPTTNFDAVTCSGTLTGAVVSVSAASALTTLTASGTVRGSGIFTASAAGKQSTLTKLNVTGTTVISGVVTASATGKLTTLRGLTVTNTATLGTPIRVTSASNSNCGILAIPAAGTASAATNKALSSSRIILTPVHATYAAGAVITTIASGTKFTVKMFRMSTAGTIGTASGRVNWLILNKA